MYDPFPYTRNDGNGMRRIVLAALGLLATTVCAACSAANDSNATPTPADETASVCAQAVSQASQSSETLHQLLLDLTAARAAGDNQAQTQAMNNIEEAARSWSTSLADHSDANIRPGVSESFDGIVTELDKFSDAAHTQAGAIIPGGAITFVEGIENKVKTACG
jgi:hypothetical protein